jgi:hypothetical protein
MSWWDPAGKLRSIGKHGVSVCTDFADASNLAPRYSLAKVGIAALSQQVRIAPLSQPILLRHNFGHFDKSPDNRDLSFCFCLAVSAVQYLFGGSQRNPLVFALYKLKNAFESPRGMRPGNFS